MTRTDCNQSGRKRSQESLSYRVGKETQSSQRKVDKWLKGTPNTGQGSSSLQRQQMEEVETFQDAPGNPPSAFRSQSRTVSVEGHWPMGAS